MLLLCDGWQASTSLLMKLVAMHATGCGDSVALSTKCPTRLRTTRLLPRIQRSADLFCSILAQPQGRLEFRFDGFAGFSISRHQSSDRTMSSLMLDVSPDFGTIGLLDEGPHPAFRVAEPGEGTEILDSVSNIVGPSIVPRLARRSGRNCHPHLSPPTEEFRSFWGLLSPGF
jgi:hypothetical protein